MEELRDNDGYLVLDKLSFQMVNDNLEHLIFYIDGVKYHFKPVTNKNCIYNELIAEELAKDYGIDSAYYDIASFRGLTGVISEDFIKDDIYIPMKNIINECYGKSENPNSHNNLMDIWGAFDYIFKDGDLSNRLMEELVNIFLFDILIANSDRNLSNYGILKNNSNIEISPVFDNSYMLCRTSLENGWFDLGVDEEDDIYAKDYDDSKDKFLVKFLKESSIEYMNLLESKSWIISEDNINKVLKRVEDKINSKIDDDIKEEIKLKFSINYDNVKDIIEYAKERKSK